MSTLFPVFPFPLHHLRAPGVSVFYYRYLPFSLPLQPPAIPSPEWPCWPALLQRLPFQSQGLPLVSDAEEFPAGRLPFCKTWLGDIDSSFESNPGFCLLYRHICSRFLWLQRLSCCNPPVSGFRTCHAGLQCAFHIPDAALRSSPRRSLPLHGGNALHLHGTASALFPGNLCVSDLLQVLQDLSAL